MTRRAWSEEEARIIHEHASGGVTAIQAALRATGHHRTLDAIRVRQNRLGVRTRGKAQPSPVPLGHLPRWPRRTAELLHDLAETPGLTLTEYHRRKAQILKGEA